MFGPGQMDDEQDTDLHMVEYGGAEGQEIAVRRIQNVHRAPSVCPDKFSAENFGGRSCIGRGSVLLYKLVAREGDTRNAVTMRIHVGRSEGVRESEVGRSDWRGGGRRSGAVWIAVCGIAAIEGLCRVMEIILWIMSVHIKNTETDSGLCEVPADGDLDGGKTVICEGV